MCILLDHLVRYGYNQALRVASRGFRHNLDQNKPMYTCVRPHWNFKQLWRNEKRSHNPHLYSKSIISLVGNSKEIEKLLTLWLKFLGNGFCPACRTSLIATRFWVVVICPIIKCLTVLEFSFILFDLCLFITIFNFILNYVPIVTFWIFTYYKIWILLIIFCFIWNYWIIYFLTCLELFWSVVS